MGLERQAVGASPFETLAASPSSFGSDARPEDVPFLRPRFQCAGQDVGGRSRPCCKSWSAKRAVHTYVPCGSASVTPSGHRPRAEGPGESEGAAYGPVARSRWLPRHPRRQTWSLVRAPDPEQRRGLPPTDNMGADPGVPGSRRRPSALAPPLRVARGSDVTARWRRLFQAAEGGFRPGRSESIRDGERASGAEGGRSTGGGARTIPSAPY